MFCGAVLVHFSGEHPPWEPNANIGHVGSNAFRGTVSMLFQPFACEIGILVGHV